MARIVIVGGGIGGLATALSVERFGHEVVVLERSPEFAELGAGIQLAPNGIHALDRLGLGDQVRASAVYIDELRFMDGLTGEHVTSMPLTGEYRARFGNPYVVVHRGDLYRQLLAACQASDAITLRANSSVVGYRDTTVELDTGELVAGDAVIGADGIHSVIRRQMLDDGDPRNSGITVYRAIIPMETVPEELRWNAVTWWAGPHCHFVHYPIAGGRFLNLAASFDDHAPTPFSGVPVSSGLVRQTFAMLGETPQRLLDLGTDWKSWVLLDRDPVDDWTDGRVVLMGDAAHPMLHYAAQGACQALEDAVVLGELMACPATEFAQRFEKYNAQRRERTARVQLAARESIRLWHPAGQDAVARNRMLGALSASDLHGHVAWMHGERDFGVEEQS